MATTTKTPVKKPAARKPAAKKPVAKKAAAKKARLRLKINADGPTRVRPWCWV